MKIMEKYKNVTFKKALSGYLFLLPFLSVYIVFLAYPIIYSLILSFHKATIYSNWYNIFSDMKFVGLQNYIQLFTKDKEFWWSALLSLYYGILTVPTSIFLSLVLAVLLNNRFKGKDFYRSAFFLPNLLDMLVVGIIWTMLYAPHYGLIDILLNKIKITYFTRTGGILGNPISVLPAIAFAMVLRGSGFGMILLLATIQNIPGSVYEAAEIDGANWWQKLWSITVPLVKPMLIYLMVTGIMGALNAFTEIYAMTSNTGGPAIQVFGRTLRAATVSGYYLFRDFREGFYGYSAAISYVLMIIAILISLINMKLLEKKKKKGA